MQLTSELFSAVAFQRTLPGIESLSLRLNACPLPIGANPLRRFSELRFSDAVLC